ncbi:hypothetical protein DVH24_021038 [Malus domestica]|uniref:Uncharacterized protein n=1 Tax=Malus domestica TaxID=3750 RepID=A0A498JAZ4_MALDO|nr:hypothetical protein DVH24_021038 [Malus domestica]
MYRGSPQWLGYVHTDIISEMLKKERESFSVRMRALRGKSKTQIVFPKSPHAHPPSFPPSLTPCQNLEHLDLSQNLLTSPTTLPNLKYLDLIGNNFFGPIPYSFGCFQKLEVFSLVYNLIESTIPRFSATVPP